MYNLGKTYAILAGTLLLALGGLSITSTEGGMREREWFNTQFDKNFYIRGRCYLSQGGEDELLNALGDIVRGVCETNADDPSVCEYMDAGALCERYGVDASDCEELDRATVGRLKEMNQAGDAFCVAKKKKHKGRGRARRVKATTSLFMKTYRIDPSGYTVAKSANDRCTGKKKCKRTISADGQPVSGLAACIEAQKKGSSKIGSLVVVVGSVPDDVVRNAGYTSDRLCTARHY